MNDDKVVARYSLRSLFVVAAIIAIEIAIFQSFRSWAIVFASFLLAGYFGLFCPPFPYNTELAMGLFFTGNLLLFYWLLYSIDFSGLAQD